MEFGEYRNTMKQIRDLAENFTNLKKSDLEKLYTLNGKCLSMKEEAVRSFSDLLNKVEDRLTGLIGRFEEIKKMLTNISGPEGTLEDALRLEPVWLQTSNLCDNIGKLTQTGSPVESEQSSGISAKASPIQGEGPNKNQSPGIQDLIVLARKEAAGAVEKAPANIRSSQAGSGPAHVKTIKKEAQDVKQANNKKLPPPKKEQKSVAGVFSPKPLTVTKVCGEVEQKLMEEINKNIELIKNKK